MEIIHDGKIEKYEIPIKESSIDLCCYDGEVTVTINVIVTKVLQLPNEECSAATCLSFTKETFSNQAVLAPIPTTTTSTTTTSTTTTSTTTTTTTIPPPIIVSPNFLNIEITNELITSIPLFDEIDLTDQEKNSIAFIITTSIIVLFYLVLLIQEWFNRIISDSRISFFRRDRDVKSESKFINFLKILIALTLTAFLIGYVEEGASLVLDLENLAIFIAAFIGLISATFFMKVLKR